MRSSMCTRARTRTCMNARTHARMHARTHARTHTRAHTRTTQTHIHIHTNKQTNTHAHTTHTNTRTNARTHARTHACTHAHTHTLDEHMTQFHHRFPKRSAPGINVEPIPTLPLLLREVASCPDNHSEAASGGISTQEHVNPLKQWSKRVVKIPSPNLHMSTHTRKHACTNFGMREKLQKVVCALRAT